MLDNDSVRVILVIFQPGADSDLHLNAGPEVTIVQDAPLTPDARSAGAAQSAA